MHAVHHILKFGGSTSMHGAPKVILTKSRPRRFLWLTIFVATWTIFGINLFFLFERYFAFNRRASVDIIDEGVPFPWITLCPMNGLDFFTVSRIKTLIQQSSGKDPALRLQWYEQMMENLNTFGNASSNEYMKELVSMIYAVTREELTQKLGLITLAGKNTMSKKLKDMYDSNSIFANMPQSTIEQNFMRIGQFIVSCQHSELDCNATDFIQLFNMQYQNCFTYAFRSQLHNETKEEAEEDEEPLEGFFDLLSNLAGTEEEHEEDEGDNFATLKEGLEAGWSAVVLSGRGILDVEENFNDNMYQFSIGTVHEPISSNKGGTGVRVVIHAPNTTALPMAEGYDVPPGYSASFAIKLGMSKLLHEPYGKCSHHSHFDEGSDIPYRQISCISQCIQEEIVQKCGCVDSTLPVLSPKLKLRLNKKSCRRKENVRTKSRSEEIANSSFGQIKNVTDSSTGYNNDTDCLYYCRQYRGFTANESWKSTPDFNSYFEKLDCGNRVRKELLRDVRLRHRCHCHPPCDEYTYGVSYSLSKWPATGYEGFGIYRDIFHKRQFHLNFNSSADSYQMFYDYAFANGTKIMKDFSRINVYIEDNSVVITEEVPDYTVVQLLSDIGGQLGIWIGVSFLTMSEVVETVFLICRDTVRLFFRGGSEPSENEKKGVDGMDEKKEETDGVDGREKDEGVGEYDVVSEGDNKEKTGV